MAEVVTPLGKKAIFRLDAAADLLQARGAGGWGLIIQAHAGEAWHQAVLRTIRSLPQGDQLRLKGLVDWVQDYELGAPARAPVHSFAAPLPPVTQLVAEHPPAVDGGEYELDDAMDLDEEAAMMAMASVTEFLERPGG